MTAQSKSKEYVRNIAYSGIENVLDYCHNKDERPESLLGSLLALQLDMMEKLKKQPDFNEHIYEVGLNVGLLTLRGKYASAMTFVETYARENEMADKRAIRLVIQNLDRQIKEDQDAGR